MTRRRGEETRRIGVGIFGRAKSYPGVPNLPKKADERLSPLHILAHNSVSTLIPATSDLVLFFFYETHKCARACAEHKTTHSWTLDMTTYSL